MATSTLVDLVKIQVLSSGTGAFSLGAAVPGFRGLEALSDGMTYSYSVQSNSRFEIGTGVFLSGSNVLVRTPLLSSAGNAAVAFPANVELTFTALAQDFSSDAAIEAGTAAGAAAGAAAAAAGLATITAQVDDLADEVAGKEPSIPDGSPSDYWRGDKTFQPLNKSAVGLANVDNTSDVNKPVSTAQAASIATRQANITATTTADYYRGDKTFQPLNKTAVGLANVDNTADAAKPVSTATATALAGKEPTIAATTTADYYRGDKSFQPLNKTAVGLGNVDNTSDANKPVSTAQQTALNLKVSVSALALGTGASGVGWTAAGTGGTLRTQDVKNADIVDPRDYAAAANGTTDDRTALFNANAVGPIRIAKDYRVSSNLTLSNTVTFAGGSLVIDSGVTVTLSGGVIAPPDRQIFKGTGNVAGLFEARFEWFAGDLRTTGSTAPVTDCRARLQAALDSVAPAGLVRAGVGNWLFDGSTAVVASAGQSFEGSGYGLRGTAFYWPGATRNFITKLDLGAGTRGGTIKNFSVTANDQSTTAATSVAINVNHSDVLVADVILTSPYDGITFTGMVIGRANNTKINYPANRGYRIVNSLDVFIDQWNVSASADIVVTTGTPTGGAFVVGESVNCPTGSSGTVTDVFSPTKYRIAWIGIVCPNGGTINNAGSTKTATVAGSAVPCQAGQIAVSGTCESIVIGNGDGVGGLWSLLINGAGSVGRVAGNSGFNVVAQGAYFDTAYQGAYVDGGYGWEIDGWFATSRNVDRPGLTMVNCLQITGSPRTENNAGSGVLWDQTSRNIYLEPRSAGNGRNFTQAYTADITVLGAAQKFSLGGFAGFPDPNGNSAPKSLYIQGTGAGDFKITTNVPNGSVVNLCTGDSQHWWGVTGTPNRMDVTSFPVYATNALAIAGGLKRGMFFINNTSIAGLNIVSIVT